VSDRDISKFAEGALKPAATTVVSVCMSCRMPSAGPDEKRAGALMFDALAPVLQAEVPDARVRAVQCLGVCKRPATIAVSAACGYTFVFGDLDAQSGPAAIASFVRSYQVADLGFVPWAERPELLRSRLVARIPSVLWNPDDGCPPA
jgi:predicted metal-binding protein